MITLKQIAARAGTSVATVSLVLRGKPVRCSAATAENIRAIARMFDYVPNRAAVSLVRQKTDTVGIVVPDIENAFFAGLFKRLDGLFAADGYALLLCCADRAAARRRQIELLRRRNVDAIILAVPFGEGEEDRAAVEELNALGLPHIAADACGAGLRCGRVEADHRRGGELAADYLLGLGHARIGCITGGEALSSRLRLEGVRRALERSGRAADVTVLAGDYTFGSGYACARALFGRGVTAVFAFNDMMAYGVMKAASEAGLRIPRDLSLVGYDDVPFSAMAAVPLTTVRQPVGALAEHIHAELTAQLRGLRPAGNVLVGPELVVRGSAAPPAAGQGVPASPG